ncbi:MAG: ATP-binding protein [Chitinophagaceae bacterium]
MLFPLKHLAFTCILIICCLFTQAQPLEYDQRVVDSIMKALPTAKDDSNKVTGMLMLSAMNLQRFDSAGVMDWANKARAVSEKTGYSLGVLMAIGQKAFYHSITSNWPVALQEINEAMRLSTGKDSSFKKFLYNLRVIVSNTREDYQDAKYWAMLSLHDPDFGKQGVMSRWPTYMQLGIIYDNLNMTDSAAYYGEKCREIMKLASFRDLELNTWLILGSVALKRKNYPEALAAFRQFPELALGTAKTFSAMGVKDSAEYYGKLALEKGKAAGIPQTIMAATGFLSALYEKDNPVLSLAYQKEYAATRDQMFNAEKIKTIEALQLTEQQSIFDAQQKEAKARNRLIQLSLLGLAALLLISALFLYRVSAVRKSNNEKLTKAYDELKQTQQKLIHAEKMASLGELTAGIAHEIQNPLNFVNNFADLNTELIAEMQDNKKETSAELQELRSNTEKIVHHGKRAEAIVKSMLQHSNIRSGVLSEVQLNTLLNDALKKLQQAYQQDINEGHIEVITQFDPSLPVLKLTPQEISAAMTNVLNNAFQAVAEKIRTSPSPYQGKVQVATEYTDKFVTLSITDNGTGIAPQHLSKIFQPFFTTKPTGQGTGLGLSLAYDIVKSYGGEINVMSSVERETKFTVVLPIA